MTSNQPDLYYNITSNVEPYTVEVTSRDIYYPYNEGVAITTATIPSTVTYNGTTYSVTSIGDYAFYNCSSLTSATIPNSVTSIGMLAFDGCSSLTFITIPNSVTSIGVQAFYGCSSLTSVTIPNSVTSIGENAFFSCSLTSPLYNAHCFAYMPTSYSGAYTIPEGIEQIVGGAFRYCSSLTSITIPNSVTSIGKYAFEYCSSLTSVTIPNSVTSIGSYAFEYCSSLTSITIPNNVTSIGVLAFDGCSSLTSPVYNAHCFAYMPTSYSGAYTIPIGIEQIAGGAFSNCSSLTSITIPNSITSIGDGAFAGCSSLTSITIPNSVTSIGSSAFDNCSSLTSPVYNAHCFAYMPTSYSGAYTIPEGIEQIAGGAFYNCSALTSITIPNSVTSIGYGAFIRCSSLTSITIPNSVTSIGMGAFQSCSSLSSVTIGNSVTSIGWGAFSICTSLTSVTCEATTPPTLDSDVFYGVSTSIPVYVPCGSKMVYKAASGWNDFTNIQEPLAEYSIQVSTSNSQMGTAIVNYNSCAGAHIFARANYGYHFVRWSDGNTDNPRSLVLTQDTTLTAEFAQTFSGQCGDNLYWSYQNNTLTISGFGGMYDNRPWGLFINEIQHVVLPNAITHIGDDAFSDCTGLNEITIPYTVTSIGDYAFAGCRKLVQVNCYAINPPMAESTSFANYNVYLNVPCDNLQDYQLDMVFGSFKYIQCMEADSENVPTDDVVVTPGSTNVTITWPTEEGADTYTIVIKKDGEVVCTLTFNSEGQLISIAFAPGRDGNHPAQYAEQAGKGYRFTVTSLESGTKYGYNIDVKDASNKTIKSHTGAFTTQSTTAVDNITTNNANIQKIMRNGQLIIVRDGVEYNAIGVEL